MQSLQTSMKELIKSDWIPGQDLLIVMQFILFYLFFFWGCWKRPKLKWVMAQTWIYLKQMLGDFRKYEETYFSHVI